MRYKVASRTLGVIGAALAVYDLCSCMGYVYNVENENTEIMYA